MLSIASLARSWLVTRLLIFACEVGLHRGELRGNLQADRCRVGLQVVLYGLVCTRLHVVLQVGSVRGSGLALGLVRALRATGH